MLQSLTLLLAIIAGASAFMVMSFVMTATPISMHLHEGHSLVDTKWVLQSHITAMFLPSLITPWLVRLITIRGLMLAGLAATAVAVQATVKEQFRGERCTRRAVSGSLSTPFLHVVTASSALPAHVLFLSIPGKSLIILWTIAYSRPHFKDKHTMTDGILIGGSQAGQVFLNPRYANRHGLVAGATGTGKTVTLQCLAEGFSDLGVPVFLADIKGDISGISQPGTPHPKIDERVHKIGIENYSQRGYPVAFWDLFGKKGTPVRATISEMGPQLISRLLELNETQESVITLVFEFADNEGMLLVDLKDLRTTLEYLGNNSKELGTGFGVSKASVNAILRRLLMLEREGGDQFFGEPALLLEDFMRTSLDGRGMINVLAADKLIMNPRVYSTFLLWLLSELFENLPELGDPEKPVLVFFFDEAHLLFRDTPKALLEKIEQVVRLIRSKGVGIYFISQSPSDIPDSVLGQLGNRVQHALRAYTPKEQKAVRVAAQSFRTNPDLDTVTAITELGVGEALVSMLQDKGIPAPVQRVMVRPPHSRMGEASAAERQSVLDKDINQKRYGTLIDPRSAHEVLLERTAARQKQEQEAELIERAAKTEIKPKGRASSRESAGEAFLKSVARAAGSSLGRKLFRGVLGSLLK